MSEEYGNDFVTLIDEDGNEVEFEHIDTVEYNGVTYLAFIPAEISIEEDAEVVIMQIVEENGEELLDQPVYRLIDPALFDSDPFLTHIFSTGLRKVLILSSRPPGYTRKLEAQRYQTEDPPA